MLVVFFFKNKVEKNNLENNGLVYKEDTLQNLVSRDTDGDGIFDWEESLWGTDPQKSDTDGDGVNDAEEIEQRKQEDSFSDNKESEEGQLSKTEQLSRELFSTISALTNSGAIDEPTVEALSDALSQKLTNSTARKVFMSSDLKISNNNSVVAVRAYSNAVTNIYAHYDIKKGGMDVLKELIQDEEDLSVLSELDPIISKTIILVNQLVTTEVPSSLASLHLDLINATQRIMENTYDFKSFDTDVVVAIAAITEYEKNVLVLQNAIDRLGVAVDTKLKS